MSKPARPDLKFASFDALLADAARLRDGPYEQTGKWDLGMILDHLAKTIAMPFDPKAGTIPAPLQPLARAVIRRMVRTRRYPTWVRFPVPAFLRPAPGADPAAAYDRLAAAVERLRATPGDKIERTPFGVMPRPQFYGQQLVHAAHHLSYLKPAA